MSALAASEDTAQSRESRRTLLFVNNIPTPYRLHLFRSLHQIGAHRGIDVEVWYMASTEANRNWSIDVSGEPYRSRVFRGIHPRIKGISAHFNPEMATEFARFSPTWAVFGGSWLTPSTFLLSAMPGPIARDSRRFIWSEANAEYSAHSGGVANAVRTWLYEHADGVVVPGSVARETIIERWRIRPRRLLTLPNLVDERRFVAAFDAARPGRLALRRELGIQPDRRVLLLAARLFEPSKGVLNFLRFAREAVGSQIEVVVAGEGPDRPAIERWKADNRADNVHLLGHVSEQRLIELLAAADAACLPSYRDPNPLFLIESLWSGLPLIVSDKCGNWPEVLQNDANGWLISPTSTESVARALRGFASCSDEDLRRMGEISRRRASQEFSTPPRINAFFDQLEGTVAA